MTALGGSTVMLAQARRKMLDPVEFLQGDAQMPGRRLASPSGGPLTSCGLREVRDPERSLGELTILAALGGLGSIHDHGLADPGSKRLRRFTCRVVGAAVLRSVAGCTGFV
jgi:hypothetical protein